MDTQSLPIDWLDRAYFIFPNYPPQKSPKFPDTFSLIEEQNYHDHVSFVLSRNSVLPTNIVLVPIDNKNATSLKYIVWNGWGQLLTLIKGKHLITQIFPGTFFKFSVIDLPKDLTENETYEKFLEFRKTYF